MNGFDISRRGLMRSAALITGAGTPLLAWGSSGPSAAAQRGMASPDSPGTVTPEQFGALRGSGDVTPQLNRMLASMGGNAETGRHRSVWGMGVYDVEQLRLDVSGASHFFDGALLRGVASSRTASIVDLRGGHTWVRGLRVAGQFSAAYACGVHHYSNDLSRYYPGHLDVIDMQVEGCEIGLVIGALPEQPSIPWQTAKVADDEAINAPLSELVYTNPRITNCPHALFMRQPNGKVTVLGGRINSESGYWPADRRVQNIAVTVADPGSELALIGGTLEHVQGGDSGSLAQVLDGRLTVADAAVETTVPSYVDGTGVLIFDRIANGGINSAHRAFVEVGRNARGNLTIARSSIGYPPGHMDSVAQASAIVQSVSMAGGEFAANPAFLAHFQSVELREPPIAFSGAHYRPIVRGLQASFADCTIVAIDGAGERLRRWRLDDGPELLAGRVDRSAETTPAYPATVSRLGGWTVQEASPESRMGRLDERLGPYPLLGEGLPVRLAAGEGKLRVVSPWLPAKKDGLLLLRAMFRTGTQQARLSAAFNYLDFAQQSVGRSLVFSGSQAEFGPQWQPIMLAAQAPAEAEYVRLVFELSPYAQLDFAIPSLR